MFFGIPDPPVPGPAKPFSAAPTSIGSVDLKIREQSGTPNQFEDGIDPPEDSEALADGVVKGVKVANAAAEDRRAKSKRTIDAQNLRILAELRKKDQQIRAHNDAHVRAGGTAVAGSANLQTEIGPDQRHYAVGGHVEFNLDFGTSPEEIRARAESVLRSALAPTDPSPADLSAARAAQGALDAARALEQAQVRSSRPAEPRSEPHTPTDGHQHNLGPTPRQGLSDRSPKSSLTAVRLAVEAQAETAHPPAESVATPVGHKLRAYGAGPQRSKLLATL